VNCHRGISRLPCFRHNGPHATEIFVSSNIILLRFSTCLSTGIFSPRRIPQQAFSATLLQKVFFTRSATLTFHHNSISYHKYIITGGVASQKSFWGTKMFDLGEQQYFVWDAASQSTKWLNILKMGPWRPGYAYDHNHDNFYDFGISWAQHLRRHYSNFTSQHLSRSTTYHHITSFSTNKSLTKRNMPCKKHFVAIARLPPQFRLHLCVVCFVRT